MPRLIRAFVASAVTVVALAVAPAVLAADTGVDIAGFAFSPQSVTVNVGDTVTWSNADARSHTATADGGTFDTGTIGRNGSKSVTFDTAGTFPYHCRIHPSMTATILVQAATTPPPTDTESIAPSPVSGLPLVLIGIAALLVLELGRRRFRPGDPGIS